MIVASLLLLQASQGEIVYGEAGAFAVKAPKGWVLNTESGKHDGLSAVLYPKGGSWKASKAVMYVRALPKKGKTLDQYVVDEIKEFSNQAPGIHALDFKGKIRTVRYTIPKPEGYETVAYIDSPDTVGLLVLTSRDKKSYQAAASAFSELVASYRFVTDNVEIKG